jgi:hypothetical protein
VVFADFWKKIKELLMKKKAKLGFCALGILAAVLFGCSSSLSHLWIFCA